MATNNTIGLNIELPIYNSDGSSFHGLVLHKSTYDSVVMSLGDKITGDVYYPTNDLAVTTQEYVEYNGIKFLLVNHPTIVREGMASDNTQLKGMTKYTFVFYHPMYMLGNFPFTDVAVTSDETKYLSESKTFSWIGYPDDFFAKINKNLEGTEWIVEKSSRFPQDISDKLSQVLAFDKNTIADAVKKVYDEWGVPYIVSVVASTETAYAQGKRFKVVFGLPSNEIYEDATHESHGEPYVFRFGQGVGLKNNSRTPRNNKIITRIAGCGSENNVPYGYPQIPWYGDSRWDYTEYQGETINYDADGHVTNTPKTTAYPLYMGIVGGAYVKLIKHPFTRKTLMPSVFSQTVFNKVSPYMPDGTANTNYNPNTTIVDYYDAVPSEEYPYPNPIVLTSPSYELHQFEDIKPELGNDEIEDAWPINDSDRQRADTWDDSIDEDGNYKQGYFVIKLPVLSFDIYACAAITQEMQINMRGGACIGCTFTVQVDWDAYTRSFYDADGNFAPNGSQRDYVAFPNSKEGQIELTVQKDTETFGTLMPNMYQTPEQGDEFVVLGISLPLSYIEDAEERLDKEMKSYMLENNVHYFDYPLKFDEKFLRENTNILSQIRPNSIIRFDYAGNILSLFVKQLTVKYGEGVLPKYDITLADNIDVVLNQIGQVADDVERLSSIISILRQNYGKNVWFELSKKLSRVDDDVAYGNLRFRKNLTVDKNLDVSGNNTVDGDSRVGGRQTVNDIQSTEYTGDGLLDTGYRLWYEEGRAKLVIDDLVARGKFTANELETRIWTYAGGNMVFSGAGSTLFFVEYLDANENPLGYTYINQPWLLRGRALLAGGLAWSKRKAIQRELTEAEKSQVVKFRCYEYSDDGTMQTRNWWKPNDIAMCETLNKVRSKVASDGSYSGSASNTVYKRRIAGIGSKEIPMLNDGRVYDYVDLWNIYDLAGNSCKYKGTDGQEHLITDSVKGYDSSYHDWPAAGDVIVQMGNPLDTDRQSAVTIEVQGDVHGFKVYDTISDYSMANKLWVEIGYDQTTGKAKANVYGDFRFGCRESEEANGGSYVKYNRTTKQLDIRANVRFTSPTTQQETTLDNFASAVAGDLTNLQNQIDGQIESWFYNYAPVAVDSQGAPTSTTPLNVAPYSDWTTDNDKIAHLGDTFTNNSTGYCWRFSRNSTTNAFEWVIIEDSAVITALQNAARAQDTADHKRRVFTTTPFPPYEVGDLWAQGSSGELMRCIYARTATESYTATDWDKASKYTDDTKVNTLISELLNGASDTEAAMTTAFKAIRAAMNEGETNIYGGLILTNDIELRDTASTPSVRAGISGMYDSTAQGGGVAIWAGGARGDWEAYFNSLTPAQQAQATITSAYAKAVDRFDGSGYRAGGNLSWNANGDVTVKGQVVTATSRIDTPAIYLNGTDITATLNAILGMFEIQTINNVEWVHVKNNRPFYSDSDISAGGAAFGGGGGGGGASALYELNDVTPNATHDGVYGAADGYVLTYDASTTHWYAAPAAQTYVLPQATSGALGGIKIGFTTDSANKNYAVVLDNDGKAFVNVPWSGSSYGEGTGFLKGNVNSQTSAFTTSWDNTVFCYRGTLSDAYYNGTTYSTLNSGAYIHDLTGSTDTIIHFQASGSASGLDLQFTYAQDSSNPLHYRKCVDSNGFAGGWVTIIDSNNIGSQSVSYASSAGSAGSTNKVTALADITYGANYLQYNNVYSTSSGNSATAISNPTAGWYHHIVMNHGNNAGYFVDMAILFDDDNFYYRRIVSGNANSWVRVIDSSNIGSQSVSYATTSGTATYANSAGSASSAGYATSAGSASSADSAGWASGAGYISDGTMDLVAQYNNELNFGGSDGSGTIYFGYRARGAKGIPTSFVFGGGSGSASITCYNVYSNADVTAASDKRKKDFVENVNLTVEQIAKAPAVKFRWKDKRDELVHVGTYAQYWQNVLPESVSEKNGNLGLNYGAAAMVSVIRVAERVVTHEEEIEQLKKRVRELEHEVERLKIA